MMARKFTAEEVAVVLYAAGIVNRDGRDAVVVALDTVTKVQAKAGSK